MAASLPRAGVLGVKSNFNNPNTVALAGWANCRTIACWIPEVSLPETGWNEGRGEGTQ